MPSVEVPAAFEAFDDHAAYVRGDLPRSSAITEAREVSWVLGSEYRRRDLRVRRVFMRHVQGQEADEAFSGEFDNGWIEVSDPHPVTGPLNAAQKAGLTPMWKVEPK